MRMIIDNMRSEAHSPARRNDVPMPLPVLSVTGLALSSGSRKLVHSLSLSVGPGERVALLGASRSGKSLTAAVLAGAL